MPIAFKDRLSHAWNAFTNPNDYKKQSKWVYGGGYNYKPDRTFFRLSNERSIVMAIYNRIANDVAAFNFRHARIDENDRFKEEIKSPLNNCLKWSTNLDQTPKQFIRDLVLSMFDEGCSAIVPIVTDDDPTMTNSYDIYEMRVGKVIQWFPGAVMLDLYNQSTGNHEQLTLPKNMVPIVENPFYPIMNEPNSVSQRLIRKLNLLDVIDEQSGSGKLDIIIQLPYTLKTEDRKRQAEERRKTIEMQLSGSKYGIAYADATERITQLNRPAENNLMSQIEYLTNMLYGQLGMSENIIKNTANEQELLNYQTTTLEPILDAIVDAMNKTFLTPTARTQGQSIVYNRNPFKLVPVGQIAEIADKFTRNEILSSNDVRQIIGMRPSDDPRADELRNKNLNQSNDEIGADQGENEKKVQEGTESSEKLQNGSK